MHRKTIRFRKNRIEWVVRESFWLKLKRQRIALKSVRKQINVNLGAPLPVIPKLWLH